MHMLPLHVNPCDVTLLLFCTASTVALMSWSHFSCRQRLDGLTGCRLLCHRQHRACLRSLRLWLMQDHCRLALIDEHCSCCMQIASSFIVLGFLAVASGSTRPAAALAVRCSCTCSPSARPWVVVLRQSSRLSVSIPVRFELIPVDLSSRLALRVSTDTKCGRDKPVSFCCSPFLWCCIVLQRCTCTW